jgi:uncharacterized membrane protein
VEFNTLPEQQTEHKSVQAFRSAFIWIVLVIIGAIAGFLDIIYASMIWSGLPDGFLRYFAVAGAILVGPVVLLILLAKLWYFRNGGGQVIWAVIAFIVEIALAILNTYVAFQLAWGETNGFVEGWRNLSPITPVIVLVLLAVLIMLDPNAKRKNETRERAEEAKDMEYQYHQQVHKMRMGLLHQTLGEYTKIIGERMRDPSVTRRLDEAAARLVDDTLGQLTQMPRYPVTLPLPEPKPADSPTSAHSQSELLDRLAGLGITIPTGALDGHSKNAKGRSGN